MFERLKILVVQGKRIIIDILIAVGLLGIYFTGLQSELPNPLQLVSFKAILVSMAIVHAHFAGKLLFGKVNWNGNCWSPQKALRVGLYLVVILAYSMGG